MRDHRGHCPGGGFNNRELDLEVDAGSEFLLREERAVHGIG